MGTEIGKLEYLNNTKMAIKNAINKGIEITDTDTFRSYANKIASIKDMLQQRVDKTNSCAYLFNRYAGTNLDFMKKLNTSNVTNMYEMFYSCTNIIGLDVSTLDTSNVTNMGYMFSKCTKLTSAGVSTSGKTYDLNFGPSFSTSNVTNMDHMFWDCSSLTSLDVSNFNTTNVTNMGGMFYSCHSLTSLDLSSFDTSNVTDMSGMFMYCSKLTSLDISSFDFTNVTDYDDMFYRVPTNCKIYVKDQAAKDWITSKFTDLTNVQIKA